MNCKMNESAGLLDLLEEADESQAVTSFRNFQKQNHFLEAISPDERCKQDSMRTHKSCGEFGLSDNKKKPLRRGRKPIADERLHNSFSSFSSGSGNVNTARARPAHAFHASFNSDSDENGWLHNSFSSADEGSQKRNPSTKPPKSSSRSKKDKSLQDSFSSIEDAQPRNNTRYRALSSKSDAHGNKRLQNNSFSSCDGSRGQTGFSSPQRGALRTSSRDTPARLSNYTPKIVQTPISGREKARRLLELESSQGMLAIAAPKTPDVMPRRMSSFGNTTPRTPDCQLQTHKTLRRMSSFTGPSSMRSISPRRMATSPKTPESQRSLTTTTSTPSTPEYDHHSTFQSSNEDEFRNVSRCISSSSSDEGGGKGPTRASARRSRRHADDTFNSNPVSPRRTSSALKTPKTPDSHQSLSLLVPSTPNSDKATRVKSFFRERYLPRHASSSSFEDAGIVAPRTETRRSRRHSTSFDPSMDSTNLLFFPRRIPSVPQTPKTPDSQRTLSTSAPSTPDSEVKSQAVCNPERIAPNLARSASSSSFEEDGIVVARTATRRGRRHSIACERIETCPVSPRKIPIAPHTPKTPDYQRTQSTSAHSTPDSEKNSRANSNSEEKVRKLERYASSSSFDEEEIAAPRSTARRSRRNLGASGRIDSYVKKRSERIIPKTPCQTNSIDEDFNRSFSSASEDEGHPKTMTPEHMKETLKTSYSKESPVMVPQSPTKRRRPKQRDRAHPEDAALDLPIPSEQTSLYEFACRCDWASVHTELQLNPRDAKNVGKDGTTALHLAVMSRANPAMRDGHPDALASLELIEQLILAAPEAAIIRCKVKRYTPLCYACLVTDFDFEMDDAADMIRLLMKHAPHSAFVFTDEGFSALDVHIISYSRLHQEKREIYTSTGRTSTVVLRTLLEENPSLAAPRLYGNRIRGPVELLYRCNLHNFKEASGEEIVSCSKAIEKSKRNSHCSVASSLSGFWAWKWTLILLKSTWKLHENEADEITPFMAVHAAAQLNGCPLAILSLAVDGFPQQVEKRSPLRGQYNLPLHEVCNWATDDLNVCGDSVVHKRKAKAIELLLHEFPKAARMSNNESATPLQLAIETCTPWDKGLEDLVHAFPKALVIPRSLANYSDDSPLAKAVAFHEDDLGSVGSDEEEWAENALEACEGLYPFLIAGILSHVPERRYKSPTLDMNEDSKKEYERQLRDKDLESLRAIYGLLRAKPEALALFVEDEKIRHALDDDDSSSEECIEYLEDDEEEEDATEAFEHDIDSGDEYE